MTTCGRRPSFGHQASAPRLQVPAGPSRSVPKCCRQLHFTEVLIIGQCCSTFWVFKSSFLFKIYLPLSILVKGGSVFCIWVVDTMGLLLFPAHLCAAENNGHYPDSKSGKNIQNIRFKHRCSPITVIKDCSVAPVKWVLDDKWKTSGVLLEVWLVSAFQFKISLL